jgi:hypothetical protein
MEETEEAKAIQSSNKINWRGLFTDKFVDLIMVILGVYIAFQLNNWKLESDEKGLERFYMEDMLVDLDKDIHELKENLASLRADQKLLKEYLIHKEEWPVDSLGSLVVNILTLETFMYNQNTYQTLISGNGLSTFHNHKVRRSITEYYNLYTPILRFEEVYTTALFKWHEHFSPYMRYATKKVLDPSVIKLPVTENFFLLVNSQLADGIEGYEDALEKGQLLRDNIKADF